MTYLIDDLRLQVSLAKPGVFVLDRDRLDQAFLGDTSKETGLFVLDESKLDERYLGTVGDDPNTQWVDILDRTTSMSIKRGGEATETGSKFRTGTFTISLQSASLDPHQNALMVPGVPVRLITKSGAPVFTGQLRRIQTAYSKPTSTDEPEPRVVLTVMDAGQRLNNYMRYGVISGSFSSRIAELLGKYNISYNLTGDGGKALARTTYESTLFNHVQLAVSSENGWWYVDRAGLLQMGTEGSGPTESVMKFSSDVDNTEWCSYTELDYSFDDGAIVNDLTLNNRYYGLNDQGEEDGLEKDYVYTDGLSIATYGTVRATLETNLANQSDLDGVSARILAKRAKPVNRVNTLTFKAEGRIEQTAKLEPYQIVTVQYTNNYFSETANYRVINIAHRMSGRDWLVTLELERSE